MSPYLTLGPMTCHLSPNGWASHLCIMFTSRHITPDVTSVWWILILLQARRSRIPLPESSLTLLYNFHALMCSIEAVLATGFLKHYSPRVLHAARTLFKWNVVVSSIFIAIGPCRRRSAPKLIWSNLRAESQHHPLVPTTTVIHMTHCRCHLFCHQPRAKTLCA